MTDDPPYLTVGTEVSAKYKGAFCEAKIRKVVRVVKCRVLFKGGLGSHLIHDTDLKGSLRVGAQVEAKHPDKGSWNEGSISKIQDQSQYTVVFDDGDITTLRRSALCLKSGRHFNESETLDQLPLTHPEHFSNPVVGGSGRGRGVRRGRKADANETSDEEEEVPTTSQGTRPKGGKRSEPDVDFGRVVCVEISDKKKGSRDPWFPALVVSPSAQETVKIRIKDECLVRSFKDGRYYTVPKKEITEFQRDQHAKGDSGSTGLRSAIEKAVLYLEKDELPPHWDRDVLFGLSGGADEDLVDSEEDSMDDAHREKKDNFVAQLYKFMEERGSPINKAPTIVNKDLDLHKLYSIVVDNGGYSKVTNGGQWKNITTRLGFGSMPSTSTINLVKQAYKKHLLPFEEFNKKFGYNIHVTTSSLKPRNSRSVYRSAAPSALAVPRKDKEKDKEKEKEKDKEIEEKKMEAESVSPSLDSGAESKKPEDEPRRSRSRQDSSRSRKDKEEEDKDKDKEQKKRGKPPKEKEKEKEPGKETPTPEPLKEKESDDASAKKGPGRGGYRRKKEDDGPSSLPPTEETKIVGPRPPALSPDIKVKVGDKLSVIYPKGDITVTYDAKVMEMEEGKGKFLVHYQGWNTRYDEWITRERIAENKSHTKEEQNKAKKLEEAEEKQRGKKRGRSATPAPPVQRAPTPSSGTRSKVAARPPSPTGSIKRKRTSTDTPDTAKKAIKRGRRESESAEEAKKDVKKQEDKSKPGQAGKGKSGESVLDLNVIRSEMKGLDKMVKQSTPPTGQRGAKASVSPSNLQSDQKLDVYEFEEDSSTETPKLKMFSPRSPDKKEDKPVEEPTTRTKTRTPPAAVAAAANTTTPSKAVTPPTAAAKASVVPPPSKGPAAASSPRTPGQQHRHRTPSPGAASVTQLQQYPVVKIPSISINVAGGAGPIPTSPAVQELVPPQIVVGAAATTPRPGAPLSIPVTVISTPQTQITVSVSHGRSVAPKPTSVIQQLPTVVATAIPPVTKDLKGAQPPYPVKQEPFPHLVQPQQKLPQAVGGQVPPTHLHVVPPAVQSPGLLTSSSTPPSIVPDDKRRKQRRRSPSKQHEPLPPPQEQEKQQPRIEKELKEKPREKEREMELKKRGRDESPAKSSTKSSSSSSSLPSPPISVPKIIKLEAGQGQTISPTATPVPSGVPAKKPMLQATLPVPGAEVVTKINETISSLMQTVPSERMVHSPAGLGTSIAHKVPEGKGAVKQFAETRKMELTASRYPFPSATSTVPMSKATPTVGPLKSASTPAMGFKHTEERPLTPSFLKSQEILEPEEEDEQMRTRGPVYTLQAKAVLLSKEDSCSLLCEEEIPRSPAADSSGKNFDFSSSPRKKRGRRDSDDEEPDDDDDLDTNPAPSRPTLLPKMKGRRNKPRLAERSQNMIVMHDTTPPSSPDSFSTETGSPHVRVTPPMDEVGSSKSKEDTSDAESEDNKSYYSGSPGPGGRKSNKAEPHGPLGKTHARSRSGPNSSPISKKRKLMRRKSPTDDYARQFGYRGIRSSSGRRIQSSIDLHEAIRGPPPPPVNLSKRPISEKFNHLYADLDGVTDPEERIARVMKSMSDIREEWLKIRSRMQARERKERRKKRKQREKAVTERQTKQEASKTPTTGGGGSQEKEKQTTVT